ncbi:YSC84-related protein [Sediminibacter sp. Hel_I_10]|uniref:lipid-binding SYLF domain-containing protein n=1 Tax=Sediminibacter sp. Hel_I_10 TaxID=1392490 RepID=UPI00047D2091|nr:lipid-binding SYLF domain-containing protein [Sediminibacter sp. Hel_I_10]
MKFLKSITILSVILMSYGAVAQSDKDQSTMADANDAKAKLLSEDASLQTFFDNSAGYVIFPNVGKGGLIVGASAGNGVLYENGTAQGMAKLKELSVGLQAGGQAIIEIIFFKDEAALNSFKDGDFEFSAGVSAVVLKSGKAKAAKYKDGVAVFALPKAGLMAEASVGGQKFDYTAL